MKTIVITSGYFDPMHVGHVECFKLAKELGDELIAIVNNDAQLKLKRGENGLILMPEKERCTIVASVRYVDDVLLSIDTDRSVCKSIEHIATANSGSKIIFAKGGDRTKSEIPEAAVCSRLGITIIDGLGDKIQNSSDIIKKKSGL